MMGFLRTGGRGGCENGTELPIHTDGRMGEGKPKKQNEIQYCK